MDWQPSVLHVVKRLCLRRNTSIFARQMLIDEELPTIIEETLSIGKTPAQTMSRVLQELRQLGHIEILDDHGNTD